VKFYSAKVICIEMGIKSRETLEKYVRTGVFPPYEKSPHRKNGVGYFEDTFNMVKNINTQKKKTKTGRCNLV
jgi:hypothetical protein